MKHWLFFLFSLVHCLVLGQLTKAALQNEKIRVGEKTSITYLVELPKNSTIEKPKQPLKLQFTVQKTGKKTTDLEQLTPLKDTIVIGKNGLRNWIGIVSLTAWNEGNFTIQSPTIIVAQQALTFPSLKISVSLVPEKKGVALLDIKQSFTTLPEQRFELTNFIAKYWWFLLLPIIGVVAIYGYKKYFKKAKTSEIKRSNQEEFLHALAELSAKKLWENKQTKEHFIQFSTLFRSYLSAEFEFNFLEKTTFETTLILNRKKIDPTIVHLINQLLSKADLVKFAKSIPSETEIIELFEQTKTCVQFIQSKKQQDA
jgi:hypothetical protein